MKPFLIPIALVLAQAFPVVPDSSDMMVVPVWLGETISKGRVEGGLPRHPAWDGFTFFRFGNRSHFGNSLPHRTDVYWTHGPTGEWHLEMWGPPLVPDVVNNLRNKHCMRCCQSENGQ